MNNPDFSRVDSKFRPASLRFALFVGDDFPVLYSAVAPPWPGAALDDRPQPNAPTQFAGDTPAATIKASLRAVSSVVEHLVYTGIRLILSRYLNPLSNSQRWVNRRIGVISLSLKLRPKI